MEEDLTPPPPYVSKKKKKSAFSKLPFSLSPFAQNSLNQLYPSNPCPIPMSPHSSCLPKYVSQSPPPPLGLSLSLYLLFLLAFFFLRGTIYIHNIHNIWYIFSFFFFFFFYFYYYLLPSVLFLLIPIPLF